MVRWLPALPLLLSLVLAGCGGSGHGMDGGSMMTNSPSGPSASTSVTGMWTGSAADSTGLVMGSGMMSGVPMGGMTWQVTETGNTFSGTVSMPGHMGGGTMTMSGTLNGHTGTFTMTMPNVTTANGTCTITATGTCDFDDSLQQMHGTYSGNNSCTGPFSGQVNLTRR